MSVVAGLLAVAVVASLLSAGHTTSRGCIDFAFPYSTGGQDVYRCGSDARRTCGEALQPGGYTGQTQVALLRACRKAGLPIG